MNEPHRMSRRQAIQWMLAASATMSLLDLRGLGASAPAKGYGLDPNLLEYYKPGDLWPLTFTEAQRKTVTALCDIILPADDASPAASAVGVPDFIDEWVSAPYPEHEADRKLFADGLGWLDAESRRRFGRIFAALGPGDADGICQDICYLPRVHSKFKEAARFFARFRNLAASGYYTTPAGWKDLKYMGNVALTQFDGPPPEVLAYLKLT